MFEAPLPARLDARKAAHRDLHLDGVVKIASLPRLSEALAVADGNVSAALAFGLDEERRPTVAVNTEAQLQVSCQRCLQPVTIPITTHQKLVMVWTDEQAKALPRGLEALLVGEEELELSVVVEDEVLLALPFVNYHPEGECEIEGYQADAPPEPDVEAPSSNPFDVLAGLKPGSKE